MVTGWCLFYPPIEVLLTIVLYPPIDTTPTPRHKDYSSGGHKVTQTDDTRRTRRRLLHNVGTLAPRWATLCVPCSCGGSRTTHTTTHRGITRAAVTERGATAPLRFAPPPNRASGVVLCPRRLGHNTAPFTLKAALAANVVASPHTPI